MVPVMGLMTFPLSKQRDGCLGISYPFQQYDNGWMVERLSAMMCFIGQAVIEPRTLSPTVRSTNRLVTSTAKGTTTLSFCGWGYSCPSNCSLGFCLKVFVFSTLIAYGV